MPVRTVGRYELHGAFASGGMAEVSFGRLSGAAGFRRVVAIKRLHAAVAGDPALRAMLADEARLVSSVRHANVAAVLDVIDDADGLSLVLEYVDGESLARLAQACRSAEMAIPLPIAVSITAGVLRGLHAAHEAKDAAGTALGLVHRDVSPQNVVVGIDGVARVIDFGVAKALGRAQSTRHGEVKGKAAYMAPEQVRGAAIDRRADVFAAGIVAWELLTGRRLFDADSSAASMMRVLEASPAAPSEEAAGIPPALDAVFLRALARDPKERFASAAEMADALEASAPVATAAQVGAWVRELAADALAARAERVRAIESGEGAPSPTDDPRAHAPSSTPALAPLPAPARAELGPPATVPSRRRVAWIAAPVTLVAIAALALVGLDRTARTSTTPSPSAEVSALVPAPPRATVASQPDPAPPPAPASAVAPNAPTGAGRARAAGAKTPRPARTAKAADCSPPYTVDPSGIHVMKPECL